MHSHKQRSREDSRKQKICGFSLPESLLGRKSLLLGSATVRGCESAPFWPPNSNCGFCYNLYTLAIQVYHNFGKTVFNDDLLQLSKNVTTESSCVPWSQFILYATISHFVVLCFIVLHRCCNFNRLKVCGNPLWCKSVGAISPTVYAYFLSLCHVLVILAIVETFSLWSHLLLGTYDLWLLMLSLQFAKGSDDQNFLAIKYF